mmetsp:Transcript_27538/g.72766  ORF Transcript_27538/g.72766 Transcript_27538/m.72766 type:complete len:211 (+) Transcript_27538:970-1602(+)
MIFDAFGCQAGSGPGYRALVETAIEMKVEHVVVMEQDKLFSDLDKELRPHHITVVRLSRSGGVVQPDRQFKKLADRRLIRGYLYGRNSDLCPRPHVVSLDKVTVLQVRCAPAAPPDALPIGMAVAARPHEVVRLDAEALATMENRVLGVSASVATGGLLPDLRTLVRSPVLGFVVLQRVDVANKQVTLLSPTAQALPSPVLIMGDIDFVE